MCGCSKAKSFSALNSTNGAVPAAAPFMGGQLNVDDLCKQDNMVRVRYSGPTGNHLVSSPMRKFPTYGMHTNGDVFCVAAADQRAAPTIFVLLEEPKVEEPKVEEPVVDVEEVTASVGPVDPAEKKSAKGARSK